MTEEALAGWARSRGATPGAARALARYVLAQAAGRPAPERPSGKLLAQLEASFALPAAEVIADADGTVRFAVRLDDGEVGETVLIHQAVSHLRPRERWTVCVSSQVGRARTKAQVAVSLHAVDPAQRRALLPVARKWSLPELRDCIARAPRTVLLQWTLIEGINDADPDADALAGFCAGLDVRVNLIPLNPGPVPSQRAPSMDCCRAFQKRLRDSGIRALLRMPHGQQVGGACGQLAGARRLLRNHVAAG